jgi:hypothetical protein
MQADARKIRPVARVLVGDPKIASQGQAKAAADRMALQRADHRDLKLQHAQEGPVHRKGFLARYPPVAIALEHAAKISSGGEATALARDHRAANPLQLAHLLDGRSKSVQQLGRHAVAVVRSVQGHDRHSAALFK